MRFAPPISLKLKVLKIRSEERTKDWKNIERSEIRWLRMMETERSDVEITEGYWKTIWSEAKSILKNEIRSDEERSDEEDLIEWKRIDWAERRII